MMKEKSFTSATALTRTPLQKLLQNSIAVLCPGLQSRYYHPASVSRVFYKQEGLPVLQSQVTPELIVSAYLHLQFFLLFEIQVCLRLETYHGFFQLGTAGP